MKPLNDIVRGAPGEGRIGPVPASSEGSGGGGARRSRRLGVLDGLRGGRPPRASSEPASKRAEARAPKRCGLAATLPSCAARRETTGAGEPRRSPFPAWIVRAGVAVALFLRVAAPAPAFPPAPHHEILGMVRDEMGNPLDATGARVLLETSNGVRYAGQIAALTKPGTNYRLFIPLDAGVTDDIYRATALRPAVGFRISVVLNGRLYLPIEMRGNLASLGQPTEITRLDLTLGEDADGDGLPDAWQRAVARRLGVGVDKIRPGSDSDGDGLSNRDEYLAGTYAYDPKEGFDLQVQRDGGGGEPFLVFTAVAGRTYTVEGSANLQDWSGIEFERIGPTGASAPLRSLSATDVETTRIRARAGNPDVRFYRLRVE